MTPAFSPQSPYPVSAMMQGTVGTVSGPMGAVPHSSAAGYTPGSLLNTFGSPSPYAGGYGYGGMSGAAPAQLPWLQSLHATVGSVGALAELVGMTAEAAKHFGGSWLSLLEQAGQTAGEVAGVLEPRPPADPETGEDLCSAEDHLTAQRRRAARWLLGAALVSGLLVGGRAVASQLASPSGRGLRIVLLLAVGAAVGFSRPLWVEERSAAVAAYLLKLFDGVAGTSGAVSAPVAAAGPVPGQAVAAPLVHALPPRLATPSTTRTGPIRAESGALDNMTSVSVATPHAVVPAAVASPPGLSTRLDSAGAPMTNSLQPSPATDVRSARMTPTELRRRRLEALGRS